MIIKLIELLRVSGTAAGVFLAYYLGKTPQEVLSIMSVWVIVSIAGTSGIESLFFGNLTAKEKGFEQGSNYQIQSAIALLSYAAVALLVFLLKWGTSAELTIVVAFLFFMLFSAANHTRSIIVDKNYKWANLNRPFLSAMLIAVFWWPVVASF
ncbi:MAG: hypothetical protein GXO88_09635 [Chlorobi bacterium]|nr:hypothetical protein [Chlorobiota bacterium]